MLFSKKTWNENSLARSSTLIITAQLAHGFPDICTKDVADCWKHDIGNGRQLFWVSVADVITEVSFITSAHLIWPLNHLNMDLCCTGQSLSMYAAWSSPEYSGRYFICQQCFFQFCPIKIVWVDGQWRDKVLIPVGLSDLLSSPPRDLYYTFHQKHQRHASPGWILMPVRQRLMMCAFLA